MCKWFGGENVVEPIPYYYYAVERHTRSDWKVRLGWMQGTSGILFDNQVKFLDIFHTRKHLNVWFVVDPIQ